MCGWNSNCLTMHRHLNLMVGLHPFFARYMCVPFADSAVYCMNWNIQTIHRYIVSKVDVHAVTKPHWKCGRHNAYTYVYNRRTAKFGAYAVKPKYTEHIDNARTQKTSLLTIYIPRHRRSSTGELKGLFVWCFLYPYTLLYLRIDSIWFLYARINKGFLKNIAIKIQGRARQKASVFGMR